MFEAVLDEIKKYDRIILHRHSNPDGDALGSQIGLKHIILENFPGKQVYMMGDGAGRYGFMADSVMDQIPDSDFQGALAVILDCSAPHLISDNRYQLADKTLRIDHHLFCGRIAEIEVTDSTYESCCGLIAEFAREQDLKLNPLAAQSLFTGMVTDSGRFRYDATTSRTFALASFLMQQPIDITEIYLNLYADDFAAKKLKASFITRICLTAYNVAYIYTTLEELKALNVDTFTVSRGMVNTMADIKDVDIWVNFTETEQGVLCELRSSRFNINPIAVKYGGGGHAKASGAALKNREEAMQMLSDLDDMVKEAK